MAAPKVAKNKVRGFSFKKAFKIALMVFSLFLIILIATFFFLRSDYALNLIAQEALKSATASGLEINYDEIKGPIPSSLTLKGLKIRDKSGLFLSAQEISLTLKPLSLLDGLIEI
ncbi:MAG: AsmA family protein, partial [Deltaproteobacteria bacterium]|nr:AsmA family protein [Deltaproteobacteria bacterium]